MLQITTALIGALLVVGGLALVFMPAAIIVAGTGLLAFGLLYESSSSS